jgi:hypothetical protein
MDGKISQLESAANLLLQRVMRCEAPAARDPDSIGINALDPGAVDALFQELQSSRPDRSRELASLLGEARICLQLVSGFLGAVRGLKSLPAVVRFEVPGQRGQVMPVIMPLASAVAMTRDAKRLSSEFGKRAR